MRALRSLIFISLILTAILAMLGSGWWLYTASQLPNQIESEMDLETFLRQSIESDRQSIQFNKRVAEREKVTWPRPDFSRLPKNMVALYITEWGCPTYFQTPREDGWPWMKRVLNSARGVYSDGDGSCELAFARRLASRLGAGSPSQLAVMSDRIHKFLKKDQLVAYDLHSMQFDQGVIGVEAAARFLMQRELLDLSLAELAELQLGIPPYNLWGEVMLCTNAAQIKLARDALLQNLINVSLVSEEQAKAAIAQPVRCLSVKR
ncbi:MAG: transglycosylase domain-containing protein [Myxococcaceae bacterium]|nr:transglycosylase domain-containing protein [Myxococcaceae bacterium]